MQQKKYQTADLYLATAICILLNTNPDYEIENGRILFVFPMSDNLFKAMNSYNSGISLNVFEYAQMLKRLRAEMLMRRGMGTKNSFAKKEA